MLKYLKLSLSLLKLAGMKTFDEYMYACWYVLYVSPPCISVVDTSVTPTDNKKELPPILKGSALIYYVLKWQRT